MDTRRNRPRIGEHQLIDQVPLVVAAQYGGDPVADDLANDGGIFYWNGECRIRTAAAVPVALWFQRLRVPTTATAAQDSQGKYQRYQLTI
ncbi:MAG: hypothetical protein KDI17_06625 [Halioglobus sp.]|nr:hypothetical protein [Halioglobus sp.]